jgi:hypothetical protein
LPDKLAAFSSVHPRELPRIPAAGETTDSPNFRTPDVAAISAWRGKWAEPFLSMARAWQVGQAVPPASPR